MAATATLGNSSTILLIWAVLIALLIPKIDGKCCFEAIFNFGDSNSDTGSFYAAFPSQPSPNGMTYFKRPVGRPSDGRLYIDFLGFGVTIFEPLSSVNRIRLQTWRQLCYISFYCTAANYFLVSGISPFFLNIQLNQVKQFKAKVDELHSSGATNLPQLDIIGKSLYTFYIGQNDFTSNLASSGISGVKNYLPQVVSQITSTIKELYALGGRSFFVLNLAPIGCYPMFLVELPHDSSDIDSSGCMTSYNNAVQEYNSMLKESLRQTRQDLQNTNVVYVDTHSVLLELFQHPKSHGLQYGTKACCGTGGGEYNVSPQALCGYSKEIDGQQITATACKDPQNYVSWDGIHTTEAANKLLVYSILNGSYFDPPFSLNQLCDIQPIG